MIRIATIFLIIGVICLIAGTHYGSPVEGDTSDAALFLQFIGGFMIGIGILDLMLCYRRLKKLLDKNRDYTVLFLK